MTKPECSVIIPTRDCLAYLRVAVASARYQEDVNCEIIVIDDGSQDGTWEWLVVESRADARLRPVRLDGVGAARARNEGLAHARADLVAFLDADDQWWPGKLARQVHHHRDKAPVFSFTDYLHVDPHGGVHGGCFAFWKPRFPAGEGYGFQSLADAEYAILDCNVVGTSTVLASRKALQDANGFAECKSAEDWDLWLRLAAAGPVSFSRAMTMSYMMRPGSETRNAKARIEAMREIVGRYANRRDAAPAARAFASARARLRIAEAEEARSRGAFGQAALLHANAFIGRRDIRTLRAALSDLARAVTPARGAA